MVKTFFAIGGVLLVLGCTASVQGSDGILRLLPALILPLDRRLVAGPDIPPYLTQTGILVAYFLPGALIALVGAVLWFRKN